MRIKNRLRVNAAISVLTTLVICLMLLLALNRFKDTNNKEKIADEILTNMFERVTLRNDYIRNNSARAKKQWFARHEQIGVDLKSALRNFLDADDRKVIDELIKVNESIGEIFSAIVANREKSNLNRVSPDLSREVEDRLLNQLNMRVYDVVINGGKLLKSSSNDRDTAVKMAGWSIISVLLILVVAALVNAWAMGRAITARAARLRDGAAMIGGGDLAHRIDVKGDDEFAEISDAFNTMTDKLSGFHHDLENEIDVRRRAVEELWETRDYLENLINYANAPIIVWDASFRVTRFNHAFERLTGLTAEEVIGKPLDILFPDNSRNESMRLINNALSGEHWEIVEIPILHTDGSVRAVLWNSANILDRDHKKVVATIAQGQDISERKLAEETLQNAYEEMSKLVEERTRELREKEVLLKEIHHRVKNNMQVISSLIGLQADGSGDETVRAGLQDVTDRVRSMALVHEKLYQSSDLSRIDFAEYTRGLLGYLWRAYGAGAASVRLELDLEPVLLPVDTAVPCGLILNELAGNALKHAFRGRSEGEVTVSLKGGKAGRISLCVADNGVGLPPGLDWRQAKSLGLRLVQMLAGQLGAEVEVDGGEGTKVEILLPFLR